MDDQPTITNGFNEILIKNNNYNNNYSFYVKEKRHYSISTHSSAHFQWMLGILTRAHTYSSSIKYCKIRRNRFRLLAIWSFGECDNDPF